MNGANLVVEVLKDEKVDTVFGYPGGAVIPLFDALYDQELFVVRTCHEQNLLHGADGYSRVSGKVGVAIATSGPGATNTITGIANAYMDSIPLVVITGQVPSSFIGKDSFQEIDITGMTFSITKHNFLVRDINELQETLHKAFIIAKEGRPGPVLVDIPKDIFLAEISYKKELKMTVKNNMKSNYVNKNRVTNKELDEVCNMIDQAKRPVFYIGGGLIKSGCCDIFRKVLKKTNIPVVNTLMGMGIVKSDDRLAYGMLGMHGFEEANQAVYNSDLLIAIGVRFSDRALGDKSKFQKNGKIIHIEFDENELNKNIEAYKSINGELFNILNYLMISLKDKKLNERLNWLKEIDSYKLKRDDNLFSVRNIIRRINKNYKDSFVATDVGQHQMFCAQEWNFQKENAFLTSGGLGTMGCGLGLSIGASIASKEEVVLITGDGSFKMSLNEVATIVEYDLPVKIFLMNNSTLGMVRQWQKHFCDERYSSTDINTGFDFTNLLNAFNMNSFKATNFEELEEALKKDVNKPFFVECVINKDDHVYPLVPPAKSIAEYISK
ncbi:MAG: biosynthetic-type acetolactate synthase large subunit [Peptostreptococcaceae bacterium]|nr:biosynthetic-type acetolactate synthase large subunit [Peptostreptococcaceae bacterium]